ncbi:glycosyltransferase family 9 protein [Serratia ficaria]|uniref:glycosyltransferase family 9 protein n=1 Tax=Serratia ficaria TaxID=61651 RepID=UPI00093DB2E8|nr:hypothetical protein [Serratia ficaria]
MNRSLLEYTGSLLLNGRYIVSPYGVSKAKPGGEIKPLISSIVHNNAISKVVFDYTKAKKVTIINGLGVTLGDSIIGISALNAIKDINPEIEITLIRPEHCPDYVNEIYTMACRVIDNVKYMPFDISQLGPSDITIDVGNQLYWADFDKIEMHDFFIRNLGMEPNDTSLDCKRNYWLKDANVHDLNLGEYVLFCPNASTKIRSIPAKFHRKIVDELSNEFGLKVFGFNDIQHDNYLNIKGLSSSTARFAGIVKHAKFLYTCDSSALHLGAGFNIPTKCIFTTVKPELRSIYYNNCESVYVGNNNIDGVHNSEDEHLLDILNKELEVYYE